MAAAMPRAAKARPKIAIPMAPGDGRSTRTPFPYRTPPRPFSYRSIRKSFTGQPLAFSRSNLTPPPFISSAVACAGSRRAVQQYRASAFCVANSARTERRPHRALGAGITERSCHLETGSANVDPAHEPPGKQDRSHDNDEDRDQDHKGDGVAAHDLSIGVRNRLSRSTARAQPRRRAVPALSVFCVPLIPTGRRQTGHQRAVVVSVIAVSPLRECSP